VNNEKYPDYLCDEDGELIILPAPYPVPNLDVYENTLKKSLNFDVNRKKNYEKYLQSSKRNEVIEYQPTRLILLAKCAWLVRGIKGKGLEILN